MTASRATTSSQSTLHPKEQVPDDVVPELPPLLSDDEASDSEGDELFEPLPDEDVDNLLDDSLQDIELEASDLGIDESAVENGWTRDSEGDESGYPEDVEDLGAEDGWTSDMDEQGTDDWDDDLAGGDENLSILDDAGEEGTDESEDLGDLTFEPLVGDDLDEEIEDAGDLDDGTEGDAHEAQALPPCHNESQVLLRSIGPTDTALAAVCWMAGGGLLAAGRGIYRGAGDCTLGAPSSDAAGEEITSIAIDPAHPERIAVGTFLGGAFRSQDLGLRLLPINGWTTRRPATSVWVSRCGGSLLLRNADGELFTSANDGDRWDRASLPGRALAHAVTASDRVAVLVATEAGPMVAWSADQGRTFALGPARSELRSLARFPDVQMAAGEDLIALGAEDFAEGSWASVDGGKSFTLWQAAPNVTAVAIHPSQPAVCVMAVCRPGHNIAALVRTSDAGRSHQTVFDLGKLRSLYQIDSSGDGEDENRINSLAFDPEGSKLLVGTTVGAFVVQVRDTPPGEPTSA